jgi:antitoxin (DNA-binding transcriptional repressor) of toxin-antitoxin stability system
MSEPHAEPQAADVRAFLPRPGEPVEDYAARLRALHHDLSLVLDAVERGLAAAEAERPPARLAPVADESQTRRSPPPSAPTAGSARGIPRVEVISTPPGGGGAEGERAWSEPQQPGGDAWGGRRAATGEGAPAGGGPAAPSPERWPRQPWVEAPPPPPRTEPWVEREAAPPPWSDRGAAAPQPPAEPWGGREAAPGAQQAPWGGREAAPGAQQAPWGGRETAPAPQQAPWGPQQTAGWPAPPAPPPQMTYEPPPHAPYTSVSRRRVAAMPPVLLAAAILGWLTVVALVLALALGGD